MKYRVNDDVRFMMQMRGVSHRELAEEIGITPEQLHHWLDKELSRGKDKRIMSALHALEVRKQWQKEDV